MASACSTKRQNPGRTEEGEIVYAANQSSAIYGAAGMSTHYHASSPQKLSINEILKKVWQNAFMSFCQTFLEIHS